MSFYKIKLNHKIKFKNNFEVSHNEMLEMQDNSHQYCFVDNTLSEEMEIKINL